MISVPEAFSVDDSRVPYALYELGRCSTAELLDQLFSMRPVIGGDAQLYELMVVEGDLDLGEHGITQAGGADAHHRIQMVAPGAQGAFAFRAEFLAQEIFRHWHRFLGPLASDCRAGGDPNS